MSRSLALASLLAGCNSASPRGERHDTGSGLTVGVTAGTTEAATSTSTTTTSGLDDGTTTATTGVTTGATTGEENCGTEEFTLMSVPPNVVLVLDKSGSMLTQWMGATTRWSSLHAVVDGTVTRFDDQINFGANLFPSTAATNELGAGACPVLAEPEVPVAPNNAAAVLGGIPAQDAANLVGATPASAGVATARDHLLSFDAETDRVMVLITDGAANCSADADLTGCPGLGCALLEQYDSNLPDIVGAAYVDDGIPTYVVGIDIVNALVGVGDDGSPEANTFVELNAVAQAGGRARSGTEKFFNVTNQDELQAALSEIATQVVSCTVPFSTPPVHPDFVDVEIDGQAVVQVSDCGTEDGWMYTHPEGPYDSIELCGAACDRLVEFGTVDTTFGCPPPG